MYVQTSVPWKRGPFETANVPGTEIAMAKAETHVYQAARADHMGFEEEHRCLRREAAGGGYQDRRRAISATAPRIGPPNRLHHRSVGHEIELTEGMATTPIATLDSKPNHVIGLTVRALSVR